MGINQRILMFVIGIPAILIAALLAFDGFRDDDPTKVTGTTSRLASATDTSVAGAWESDRGIIIDLRSDGTGRRIVPIVREHENEKRMPFTWYTEGTFLKITFIPPKVGLLKTAWARIRNRNGTKQNYIFSLVDENTLQLTDAKKGRTVLLDKLSETELSRRIARDATEQTDEREPE